MKEKRNNLGAAIIFKDMTKNGIRLSFTANRE